MTRPEASSRGKASASQPPLHRAAIPSLRPKASVDDAASASTALLAAFRQTLSLDTSPMDVDGSAWPSKHDDVVEERRLDAALLYDLDVYAHLRSVESLYQPRPDYFSAQPALTPKMRAILVDWLVEVSLEFGLHEETLFAAVGFVDRFLSARAVNRQEFQLLGTVACYVAAKLIEVYPPEIEEFVFVTDGCYPARQIRLAELLLLRVLDFRLNAPSALDFSRRFNDWAGSDETVETLSGYLAELSLVDAAFLKFAPSSVAVAAVSLARHTLGYEAWPEKVAVASGVELGDVEDCVEELFRLYSTASGKPQQSVRAKYSDNKYGQVALLNPPSSPPYN